MTASHVIVHAGLDFSRPDPLTESGRDFILWSRSAGDGCRSARIGGRKIVTGQCITGLKSIRSSLRRSMISLDNGCFMGAVSEGGAIWLDSN